MTRYADVQRSSEEGDPVVRGGSGGSPGRESSFSGVSSTECFHKPPPRVCAQVIWNWLDLLIVVASKPHHRITPGPVFAGRDARPIRPSAVNANVIMASHFCPVSKRIFERRIRGPSYSRGDPPLTIYHHISRMGKVWQLGAEVLIPGSKFTGRLPTSL